MTMMQMSGKANHHHQYKPLDESTAPADVAATKDKDADVKKGCTRYVQYCVDKASRYRCDAAKCYLPEAVSSTVNASVNY